MKTILGVDPGIRLSGTALFVDGVCVASATITNPHKSGNGARECRAMAAEIVAWWKLTACKLLHLTGLQMGSAETARLAGYLYPDEYVCEWPQVYATRLREGATKEDPNDLISLSGIVTAVSAMQSDSTVTVSYKPAEWKAQVPKKVMTARILGRLAQAEVEAIVKGTLREDPIMHTHRIDKLLTDRTAHNAIDAVGLCLFHLGRLERQRAPVDWVATPHAPEPFNE